jgi:hypothetical protein
MSCNSNSNTVNEPYITPDTWNLYNVTQDTIAPTGPEYIPKFHNTHVGRTHAHYPREKIDHLPYNNYDPTTGKRCKTCDTGCANGVPIKQFGMSKKMAYSQGIQKHPECIPGKRSTGRREIVPNTITQVQHKYNVTKHDSNYTGTSKKMAYGRYINNTPGMETFASKKISALEPKNTTKQECWTNYWCTSL